MPSLSVVAWNNGRHSPTGAGYGLKIQSAAERDRYFDRNWKAVEVHLPDTNQPIFVSIDNDSFWDKCRELRSASIGRWLIEHSLAPWHKGCPPKFKLTVRRPGVFDVSFAN